MVLSPFVLPPAPSWFPGHMKKFLRILPALLTKTDVVVEIRDSRLPLTSINRNLEGLLRKWKLERGWVLNERPHRVFDSGPCEHLVVLNKKDLVPEWGIEPFKNAMTAKFPSQETLFASWKDPQAVRNIIRRLVDVAQTYPDSSEINVLVLGMPNVGKSTLLNALRNQGIQGRTPKAFKTSSQPGLTQALSTRIKLSQEPLVYAFDTPGVMVPFLGRGQEGSERAMKLSLIAGLKESLFDTDVQAAYLLYRLNISNPTSPAYLDLLGDDYSKPIEDIYEFLTAFAFRRGMVKRGGEPDMDRAALTFIRWWREEGGPLDASTKLLALGDQASETPKSVPTAQGWGFDFQWTVEDSDTTIDPKDFPTWLQSKIEESIDQHLAKLQKSEEEGEYESDTQKRKKVVAEEKARRKAKWSGKHKYDSSK